VNNSTVYILHFDRPYWYGKNGAGCQHYVGYTKDLESRLDKHRAGNGSKLCRYATNKGIQFSLVRVEHYASQSEARRREVQIKKRGGGGKLCPLCAYPGLDFKDIIAIEAEYEC